MKISNLAKSLTIVVVCILMTAPFSQAQIVKETTKKVEQKAENRVENKVDQGIDKGLNAIEGLFKRKKKKKKTQEQSPAQTESVQVENEMNSSVPVNTDNVNISYDEPTGNAEPNNWTGRLSMETVEYKNGQEKERGVMHFHIDTYKTAFITEDKKRQGTEVSTIIFDKRNRTMTTKTNDDGEKSAMTMRMPTVTVDTDEMYNEIYEEGNMPRTTGEFKTIGGYRCEKYIYEDDEVRGEAWLTTDGDFSMMDIFGAMVMNPTGKAPTPPKGSGFTFQGMVMESTSTDKRTGRRTVMILSDVVEDGQDANVFDLSGYNVIKMPNVGNMFQKRN